MNYSKCIKRNLKLLTEDPQLNLCLQGLCRHDVHNVALVLGQVVRRLDLELVLVHRVVSMLVVILVDLRAVLVPEDLWERVASPGTAG